MSGIIDCPETMSGGVKIFVAVETLFICISSCLIQLGIFKATGKFAGWQSDFSYTLLRIISVVALQLYVSEIVAHVRFAWGFEANTIDQVVGASFLTSFVTDTILGVTLVLHRVAYTIYPYKASSVLTCKLLQCYLIGVSIFHVILFVVMVTPYAGYQFCPKSLERFPVEGSATTVVLW
ncbi:hypothetical protein RB195_013038 [Necator americanus]|uniref:Uncharacterized protein n=1 Tax=Necator americanus TaxID=51031 RepID=A0ABR1DTP8_NECAM